MKDKYYVYCLFKPNGVPFYVGKGSGTRINDHFKPSNLKAKSIKNNIILKYNIRVKREILAYFKNENDAYNFEEYLIGYYGLITEKGLLANYAKTRFQYSDHFHKTVSSQGYKVRSRVYSKHLVEKAIKLYYVQRLTFNQISDITGIPSYYIGSCVNGVKNKDILFSLFERNLIPNFYELSDRPKVVNKSRRCSDAIIQNEINKYLDGSLTLRQCSITLHYSYGSFKKLLKKRNLINLQSINNEKTYIKHKTSKSDVINILDDRYLHGISYSKLSLKYKIPKTTICRICKFTGKYVNFKDVYKVSEEDNSASNLSNK